jgi:dienelactone hydrolase
MAIVRSLVMTAVGASIALGCATIPSPTQTPAPRILVDHPDALVDRPLRIHAEGFAPRRPVTLVATAHFLGGRRLQSRAVFMSDDGGTIDVATAAPSSGSYDGVSAMGLFWSMTPLPSDETPVPPDGVLHPWHVDLEASSDGAIAKTTVVRRLARTGVTRRVIREDGVVGTLFLPPRGDRRGAIIVLEGSGGGVWEARAALLASHGYAALALGYFRMPELPQGLVNIPLEYFETAIRWMQRQEWLGDGFLAVMGRSRGGELALLLAATFEDVNAVVAIVPSGVLHGPVGPSAPGDSRPPAAWTLRGRALPYLQENNRPYDLSAIERRGEHLVETPIYLSWLLDVHAVERSTIAVEQINGPVLLVSGKNDEMWPSFELAEVARRRLEAHRHPHAVVRPHIPPVPDASISDRGARSRRYGTQ